MRYVIKLRLYFCVDIGKFSIKLTDEESVLCGFYGA